jgi:hypothetical protein
LYAVEYPVNFINRRVIGIIDKTIKGNVYLNDFKNSILLKAHCKLSIYIMKIDLIKYRYLYSNTYENCNGITVLAYFIGRFINSILRIRLINIVCALVIYFYLSNGTAKMGYIEVNVVQSTCNTIVNVVKIAIEYVNNINDNFKYCIFILLLIPFLQVVYDLIIVTLKYRGNNESRIDKRFVNLINSIDENIEKGMALKYDGLNQMVSDITSDIGFDLKNSKLVPREGRNTYFIDKIDKSQFHKITNSIENAYMTIDDIYNRRNYIEYKVFSEIIIYLDRQITYNLKYVENRVLDYEECSNNYKKCREYFEYNENQIYKHIFTDARVIRKEPLELLDYYLEKAEKYVNKYREDVYEYIYKLLIIRMITIEEYSKVLNMFYRRNFIDTIFLILKLSFERYLNIFIAIAY